jgi:hypothetical protein
MILKSRWTGRRYSTLLELQAWNKIALGISPSLMPSELLRMRSTRGVSITNATHVIKRGEDDSAENRVWHGSGSKMRTEGLDVPKRESRDHEIKRVSLDRHEPDRKTATRPRQDMAECSIRTGAGRSP